LLAIQGAREKKIGFKGRTENCVSLNDSFIAEKALEFKKSRQLVVFATVIIKSAIRILEEIFKK
jgi:hypothetical protein